MLYRPQSFRKNLISKNKNFVQWQKLFLLPFPPHNFKIHFRFFCIGYHLCCWGHIAFEPLRTELQKKRSKIIFLQFNSFIPGINFTALTVFGIFTNFINNCKHTFFQLSRLGPFISFDNTPPIK